MTQAFILAFAAVLLAALFNLAGLLLIRRYEGWGSRNSVLLAAFAAGVLIAATCLQLIPEALRVAPSYSPFLLLGGYLFMYCLGLLSAGSGERTSHQARRAVAFIPLVGITIHSFIDGIAYSVGFSINLYTGVFTVIGLILHEVPEGIIAYALLLRGGFSYGRALLTAFAATALTTPIGFLLSWPLISDLSGAPLGWMLAFTGGLLFYVGASHLIPNVEHENRKGSAVAFFAGIVLAIIGNFIHRL